MESRRRPSKKTLGRGRTPRRAKSATVVRTPSPVPGKRARLGHVANWSAKWFDRLLGVTPIGIAYRAEMSVPRRVLCNMLPLVLGCFFTYVSIELLGDRYLPRNIIAVDIMPNEGRRGQTLDVQYTAKDDRTCGGIVHRWVVDSKRGLHVLADDIVFEHIPAPGADPQAIFHFVRHFGVPIGAIPGPAEYHTEAIRYCNVWQQYIWPIKTSALGLFVISTESADLTSGRGPNDGPLPPRGAGTTIPQLTRPRE